MIKIRNRVVHTNRPLENDDLPNLTEACNQILDNYIRCRVWCIIQFSLQISHNLNMKSTMWAFMVTTIWNLPSWLHIWHAKLKLLLENSNYSYAKESLCLEEQCKWEVTIILLYCIFEFNGLLFTLLKCLKSRVLIYIASLGLNY